MGAGQLNRPGVISGYLREPAAASSAESVEPVPATASLTCDTYLLLIWERVAAALTKAASSYY